MTTGVAAASVPVVLADPDRRFYAFAIDRVIAWTAYAAVVLGVVGRHGSVSVGLLLLLAAVAGVWLAGALLTGLLGATPGKRLVGLSVVGADDGRPIGPGRALLRQGVLGVLTLPTVGIGTAALAWTATVDPQRRGLHDRWAGSVVIDGRRRLPAGEEVAEAPETGIVNLTALRLRPAPVAPPVQPSGPTDSRPTGRPPYSAPANWRVNFATGESFVVSGLALVGSRPEAAAGERVAHLVALGSDPSLARTHAQFQVAPDGSLVVMDRGSAGGTVLIRGGAVRALGSHRPTTLVDGDRVRFGDREMLVRREP